MNDLAWSLVRAAVSPVRTNRFDSVFSTADAASDLDILKQKQNDQFVLTELKWRQRQIKYNGQCVKWEDTSKKEEKEDILLEKEDKRGHFFFKLNTTKAQKHQIYM